MPPFGAVLPDTSYRPTKRLAVGWLLALCCFVLAAALRPTASLYFDYYYMYRVPLALLLRYM